MRYRYFVILVSLGFAALPVRAQEQVTLTPVKDNTLYESATGSLSNGAGDHLFVGRTNQSLIRRTILAFDPAEVIPTGAVVQSVMLTLNVSQAAPGAPMATVALHRVTADWGEGSSDAGSPGGAGAPSAAGDATWIHRSFDTDTWQQAGGDFIANASASTNIAGSGTYDWESTPELVADVQSWIDDPENNFGWIVIGNESANGTAKRFDSRENPTAANRPALTITYTPLVSPGVEDVVASAFRLGQNFPDPFSGATTIPIELDAPRHVVIHIYDVLGRTVRTPLDAAMSPGPHEVQVRADGLPAGPYAYCYADGLGRQCGMMVVVP